MIEIDRQNGKSTLRILSEHEMGKGELTSQVATAN